MPKEKNNHILETVRSYGKGLMNFIRSRVKTEEDAEDIIQDVWYQLSSIVNSEPVEQTGAWLYRVAKNRIIDKHRKKKEELYDPGDRSDEDDVLDIRAMLLTDDSTPETEFVKNLFWEQLFRALDELPEEQRQVFISHELDQIPFQQIADRTGENIQTLVSRKRYAVLHLRKRLKQLYQEVNDY